MQVAETTHTTTYTTNQNFSLIQFSELTKLIDLLMPAIDAELQKPYYDCLFDMQLVKNEEFSTHLKDTVRPTLMAKIGALKAGLTSDNAFSAYKTIVIDMANLPWDTYKKIEKSLKSTPLHAQLFEDVDFTHRVSFLYQVQKAKSNTSIDQKDISNFNDVKFQRNEAGIRRFDLLKELASHLGLSEVNTHDFEYVIEQRMNLSKEQYRQLITASAHIQRETM